MDVKMDEWDALEAFLNDSKHYWRRDYFEQYKHNRKKGREKDSKDWNAIFECLNQIKSELGTKKFSFNYSFDGSWRFAKSIINASENADAIIIITEWKNLIK